MRTLSAPLLVACGALLAACGAPPPPPPAAPAAAPEPEPPPGPPAKEPVETGSDCCKAEAQCGGGVCAVFIKNDCEQAISCDAAMATTCKAHTEMVEASRRKRETFAAKTEGEISLQGECPTGEIVATAVKSLSCK